MGIILDGSLLDCPMHRDFGTKDVSLCQRDTASTNSNYADR